MGETSEFDAAQAHAVIQKLTSRFAAVLASSAALELGLEAPAPEQMENADLRALIPDAAVAMGLRDEEGENSLLLILDDQAARRLALGSLGLDAEALAARLAEASEPQDDERNALVAIADKVADTARAALGVDLASLPVDHLDNSVWKSGLDPIGAGAMVVVKAVLEIAGMKSGEAYIAATPGLVMASGRSADSLLCFASNPGLAERLLNSAGASMREVAGLPDLLARFADEAVDGALIGVAAGDEHLLATVASLRLYPGCAAKSVVVVLEEPNAWNVVRCGRLGLFSVLGPEFSAEDLARKLED